MLPPLSEQVRRIIDRIRPDYDQANREVSLRLLIREPQPELDVPLPYLSGSVDLQIWLTLLTAALLWKVTGTHDTGTDWASAASWSPCNLSGGQTSLEEAAELVGETLNNMDLVDSLGTWMPGWQPSPPYPLDLYHFDVCVNRFQPQVLFRHTFFGRMYGYTCFRTSPETAVKIEVALT